MRHTQDPTQLFHQALEALAQGNIALAHDYAIAAARIYQQQGSSASAKLAFDIASDPEKFAKAS